jgi:hypothetical protein
MELEFFERPIFDFPDFGLMVTLFILNVASIVLIIKGIYEKNDHHGEHVMSFYVFNVVIFVLCMMMGTIKDEKAGFAFGLFAILSILRYRTETIPIREMSYMFIAISLGVVNSLTTKKLSFAEVVLANAIIVVSTYIFDRIYNQKKISHHVVKYDKVENLNENSKDIVVKELSERLGMNVVDIEIVQIDMLTDSAMLKVFYQN